MKKLTPHKTISLPISTAVILLMAGCASIPPPVEQMAVSKAAVNSANSAGGNEFAPVLLKSAMDKLDAAERAMTEKDYVVARRQAEQAQVDAQLAAATARSSKAQKAAGALQEDNRVLRQEIDRKAQ
jgi:septal ring factor EnvC (AmiA/AmiB activator)